MKFHIPDMSCGHCTSSIQSALTNAFDGTSVTCDLDSRMIEITNAPSAQQIIDVLDDIGFDAEPA